MHISSVAGKLALFCSGLAMLVCSPSKPSPDTPVVPVAGAWRGVFESPGGALPFDLYLEHTDAGLKGSVSNASEVLGFDEVAIDAQGNLTMSFSYYDSHITAQVAADGRSMKGAWRKTYDHTRVRHLPFSARAGEQARFQQQEPPTVDFSGRWSVVFVHAEDGETNAVGEFQQNGNILTGTFLTPTGDYRFLEGVVSGKELYLSCFDGGHAFLFTATFQADGSLKGDFWSSDKWHETWTANRDAQAALPDVFQMTHLQNEAEGRFRFDFPDLEGNRVTHQAPFLQNKVRLVTLFGSWCPNCNDEAPFLQDMYETYRDRGLEVVGLAFEATGDKERDSRMLKRFIKRHRLTYPILLAGQKDKADAAKLVPDLNHVLAYPTTLFINRAGVVVDIHTGFTGPGTGEYYEEMTQQYHTKIQALLEEGTKP